MSTLLQALRASRHNPGRRGPTVVSKRFRALGTREFDVCVAGGTLGLFLALALQVRFLKHGHLETSCLSVAHAKL